MEKRRIEFESCRVFPFGLAVFAGTEPKFVFGVYADKRPAMFFQRLFDKSSSALIEVVAGTIGCLISRTRTFRRFRLRSLIESSYQ